MKKILTLSLLLYVALSAFGQSELSREQLEKRISDRELTIPTLKNNQQVDSLTAQVEDLKALVKIIDSVCYEIIFSYETLLSNDTTVFTDYDNYIFLIGTVPVSMKKHWDIIANITNLKRKMDSVDNTIASILEQPYKISEDLQKQVIQESISSEVDEIYNLYLKISTMDLSTFSDEQIVFFENLKKRYNKYSIYFE